jgi:hypothetical protein
LSTIMLTRKHAHGRIEGNGMTTSHGNRATANQSAPVSG